MLTTVADGVLETTNAAQDDYGADRFLQFLDSHSALPAGEFADQFLAELAHWSGRPAGESQEDDITMVVLYFPSRD